MNIRRSNHFTRATLSLAVIFQMGSLSVLADESSAYTPDLPRIGGETGSALTAQPEGFENPEQNSQEMLLSGPQEGLADAEWTPELYLDAIPTEMPEVDLSDIDMNEFEALMGDEEPTGEAGSKPSEKVRPDRKQFLFDPAERLEEGVSTNDLEAESFEVPQNVGSSGTHFSSSRIVPKSAAAHYPYRAVGKLFYKKPDGSSWVCSAAAIKPRLILTAGHCVHSGNGSGSGWNNSFRYVPSYGAYGDGSSPYKVWNWQYVRVSGAWYGGGGTVPNAADYAIIELRDKTISGSVKKIGNVTGWLGYLTNRLHTNHAHILGFPGNKDGGKQMHQVTAESWKNAGSNTATYGSDMRGGSSGGPFVQNFGRKSPGTVGLSPYNAANRVIGVVSYGPTATSPLYQGSSKLGSTFTSLLNYMCGHKAGNC